MDLGEGAEAQEGGMMTFRKGKMLEAGWGEGDGAAALVAVVFRLGRAAGLGGREG